MDAKIIIVWLSVIIFILTALHIRVYYHKFFIDYVTQCKTTQWLKYFIKFRHTKKRQKYHSTVTIAFKLINVNQINELYNNDFGDKLLKICADKLKTAIRLQKNAPILTVTRDQTFLVTCYGLNEFEITLFIKAMLDELQTLITLNESKITPFFIAGAVKHEDADLFKNKELNLTTLQITLEKALNQALQTYQSTYFIYSPSFKTRDELSFERLTELKKAIDNREFVAFYQPIYNASTHEMISVEALVRWNHPQKGYLPPFFFLEDLEHFKLMSHIDFQILEYAITDIACLNEKVNKSLSVSVNFSLQTIMKKGFVERVLELLETYRFPPENLIIEITEHTFINNLDLINNKINRLSAHGIKISLDDFGSGYSNLAALSQVKFDNLKLDRSIVQSICEENTISHLIYLMVLNLIRTENKTLTCEGIETNDMIEMLGNVFQNNINLNAITDKISFQGYYFSKPLPLDEITEKIKSEIKE